jgi:hypothetical protein
MTSLLKVEVRMSPSFAEAATVETLKTYEDTLRIVLKVS